LVVNDGVAAIQFYEAAFGAVCNSKHLADDGKRLHADLLENQFWGMRYGKLKDPFGHLWSIGGPLE
jgi:uncharacterized glyoxalase superfamily protein PhnB